ncbi:hypothetical protein ETC03_28070, partial [Geobacillus sp. MMMUD3]|nr:hypothetical protein [Geobacillus sp. MMMUD3]
MRPPPPGHRPRPQGSAPPRSPVPRRRPGPAGASTEGPEVRYAYLGPEATFTEAALLRYLDAHDLREQATTQPMRGAAAALDAVLDGDCLAAVVPIENSVEGGVPATIDALTEHGDLQI